MITMLAVLVALAAVACWICLSPARIAVAAVPVVAAHPNLTLGITATIASVVLMTGVVIVWRSLRASGWRLLIAATSTEVTR